MENKYFTLWLMGRPCSGKTTLAENIEKILRKRGVRVIHLDGDCVRKGLNSDLGFSKEDRAENLRRIAHVAELFNQKGNYVLVSFISPIEEYRNSIKKIISNMKLVYVNASLEECIRRDVKGMYAKALRGEIRGFTGIDANSSFEIPKNPEMILYTKDESIKKSVEKVLKKFY